MSRAARYGPNPLLGDTGHQLRAGTANRRVHLSLESVAGRPGADEEAPYAFYAYSVPLRVGREDLLAAARA